jgi:twitching motility protein PilT
VCVCEILRMTGRARDMILDPAQTNRLHEVIVEGGYYGMQSFDQALFDHLRAGRVTLDDAMRAASNPHDFKLLVAADGRRATTMADLPPWSPDEHVSSSSEEPAPALARSAPPPGF